MKKNSRLLCIKLTLITFMILFLGLTAHADEMGMLDTSAPQIERIQTFIEKLMKEDQSIKEINVHATGSDGDTKLIASTTPGKAGKTSDPEDIDAIIENKIVVITEGDVLDITVPMANEKGMPSAVAGIRILSAGKNSESVKSKAADLAKQIDAILITK